MMLEPVQIFVAGLVVAAVAAGLLVLAVYLVGEGRGASGVSGLFVELVGESKAYLVIALVLGLAGAVFGAFLKANDSQDPPPKEVRWR